jgi:glycerophosphoryl diester phosphodiesterase
MEAAQGRRAAPRRSLVCVGLALSLLAAAPAGASPYVHAHRGGSLETSGGSQVPRFAENTLPAFEAAADAGFVLELDVKLTSDDVPVVIHDATLDRTTDCTGPVRLKTLAQIRHCEVDIIGTSANSVQLPPDDPRRSQVPTLTTVPRAGER